MLMIQGDVSVLINEAIRTNSLDSLTTKLEQLNTYGDDEHGYSTMEVWVFPDKDNPNHAGVSWFKGNRFVWSGEPSTPFMIGGLVRHHDTWGTHT